MIVLINTTPVVELYPFQSGKLFLLHLLHGDVDLHGDDVHHVDVKHLEVIQDLQTIHVLIIKSLQFWSTSRKSDLIHFDFAFMMGLLLPHHLLLGGVHQQDSGVHHHKQANERSRRIVNTIPFINWYILMSIDSVYIFVTCRLSFNLSHNYFIGSLKGKKEKTIYSNSLAGLFLDLFTFVLQVRLFWGEGAGTIWQVDKLDTDAVIMANIKQDELWVDLLFDGTASFYLALAESKRFRLGLIRNGKISYRLYPKRKDFVSLNVAIKNLAALQWQAKWYTHMKYRETEKQSPLVRLWGVIVW